ncbi:MULTISPECIES: DNA-binding protein [unclassified Micromonospora]|uniref:DNA-binding protein n=1 Tax=unclassified Micromonospora TaxID=2617518 RepID=UPI001C21480A|nr:MULTISPECIES: DNA-binding protein [unclassified Micromonospora]MBU8860164.1 DNA-binding protein [Micromonospora sp. WMMB482]MDM4779695.1 DNA-binding protein [Micromonospora sp. b486]
MVTVDNDPFTAPDAAQARTHRNYAALLRIAERHAGTSSRRRRYAHPDVPDAYEAATLVMALAGGAELEEGEEPVDQADLMAALTLIPHVRAEVDVLEAGLLQVARGRGMTWQAIAFGLGLGSAQAARQRYERLTVRTGTGD